MTGEVAEGEVCDVNIKAKSMRGEGIGMLGNLVVFVKNAKTRIGRPYKVRITKLHRTFAYAEPVEESKYFIGNGSLILQQ